MADDSIERIPIRDILQEDGAHELVTSPDMRPYLELAKAVVQGFDPAGRIGAIRQLPLEKRYVWRVASALKWGFADCDDLNVAADRQTLSPDDLAKLVELLRLRPIQFCTFLRALVGADEMRRMMTDAIEVAGRA